MPQWKPGQSGNPGGRPKVLADVQALARQYTTEAIETLRDIMRDKRAPAAARAAAATTSSTAAMAGQPKASRWISTA